MYAPDSNPPNFVSTVDENPVVKALAEQSYRVMKEIDPLHVDRATWAALTELFRTHPAGPQLFYYDSVPLCRAVTSSLLLVLYLTRHYVESGGSTYGSGGRYLSLFLVALARMDPENKGWVKDKMKKMEAAHDVMSYKSAKKLLFGTLQKANQKHKRDAMQFAREKAAFIDIPRGNFGESTQQVEWLNRKLKKTLKRTVDQAWSETPRHIDARQASQDHPTTFGVMTAQHVLGMPHHGQGVPIQPPQFQNPQTTYHAAYASVPSLQISPFPAVVLPAQQPGQGFIPPNSSFAGLAQPAPPPHDPRFASAASSMQQFSTYQQHQHHHGMTSQGLAHISPVSSRAPSPAYGATPRASVSGSIRSSATVHRTPRQSDYAPAPQSPSASSIGRAPTIINYPTSDTESFTGTISSLSSFGRGLNGFDR